MMLEQNKNQFEKEQSDLLKTILNERYFIPWSCVNENETSIQNDANLEIFITNACNQNCEYCYLTKYNKLYPEDKRSPELLLHNLRILYEYILENQFYIPKVEFFTGEIWHTQFGLDVLDVTIEYLKKGLNVGWFMIASNCSFIFDKIQTAKIQSRINEFERCGNRLCFSASVDGQVIDEMERPINNKSVRTEEFYEDLFCFCKHNNYGFHPMVSSQSTKYWIENHKWWEKKFKEWDMDIDNLMMLEVRNADWTEESIAAYNNFMNYLIDKFFNEKCNGDVCRFGNLLMNVRGSSYDEHQIGGYIPWAFPECDSFAGCTVATDLTVRLGDLAICPCHRTAYNKYLYGHFVVENDKIVDIQANNPQMAIKILMANFNITINRCDLCPIKDYCLKGCFGSQLETVGDPFIPIPNVCTFFLAKARNLVKKYKDMGVIDYYKTFTEYELDYDRIKMFLNMVERLDNSDVG